MNNNQILNQLVNDKEKAAFKSMRTDMETGKAILNPEQFGQFMRMASLDNTILAEADFQYMKTLQKDLNTTGINGRVLTNGYKADGTTDPDIAEADVTFGANELNARKLKAKCALEDDDKEDNIEGMSFEQTLLSMMGERIGEDLEYWSLFGDTTISRSTNPLLNSGDGWVKKCSNKLESEGLNEESGNFDISKGPETMFDAMIKALPARFRKNRSQLRFYVPFAVEDAYRNILMARGTTLGDSAQTGFNQLYYKGIPLVHCHTLDADDAISIDNSVTTLLTNPKNLAYGVYKNISVEPKRIAEDELTEYYFRMRGDVDFYFRNGSVVAKMTDSEAEELPELSLS